jgi:hypothetical protein
MKQEPLSERERADRLMMGQGFGERRENTTAALYQNNRSVRGIDTAKVATQRNGLYFVALTPINTDSSETEI